MRPNPAKLSFGLVQSVLTISRIEQAMKMYQGLEGSVRLRPRIEHCSMTEIEFLDGAMRLLRYNDLSPIGVA